MGASSYPKIWADHPFPMIPYPKFDGPVQKQHAAMQAACLMVNVHNCFLRTLNAIYIQAPHINKPEDIKAFLRLVGFWEHEIHHHHQSEEDIYFPKLEEVSEPDLMKGNLSQHQAFEPGLKALKNYAENTSVEQYDGMKLRKIIDDFGPVLTEHLGEEIDTLLALKKFDSEKLMKAHTESHHLIIKSIDTKIQFPLILGGNDKYYDTTGAFVLPWFLYYLVHYWESKKHADCWKFLPSTTWGEPREMPFALE